MEKNQDNKIIKAGIGYTIANYLLKGLSFFTIPIFSRLMTTSDYGIFNTYSAWDGIFFIIIGLALHSSFKNAKYKYKTQFNSYVSSCILLSIVSLILWLFFGNVLYPLYGNTIGFSRIIINILFLNSFGNALIQYYNVYLGLDYKYKNYFAIACFNAIFSVLLSVLLMLTVFKTSRYLARILGTAIPVIIISIYVIIYFKKKEKLTFNRQYWKYSLNYSLPIVPHGLSQVILSQFDRIMISSMVGASEAGIYSFGYNIYSLINVTASSLDNVWGPWFYEKMNEGKEEEIKNQGSKYAFGMMLFSVLVMMLSPEVIKILGTEEYHDAVYVVIPIVLGGFFSFLYTLPVQIEYYYEKTKYIATATGCAAIINIVLNWIFINKYSYIAAAYTTLFTYLLYFAFHFFLSIRIAKRTIFDIKRIVLISFLAILGGFVSLTLVNESVIRWFLGGIIGVIMFAWLNKEFNIMSVIKRKFGGYK